MSLKLIRSIDSLDGEVQFNSEPGRITSLLIVAEGVNSTGQTNTPADVGRFLITRNGDQTHNRNFPTFRDIGDINAGTNLSISEEAGQFLMSATIPFYESGHPNALNVRGENELNIRFQPAAGQADIFDNLQVNVYARMADLPERYQFYMLGNDVSYASAVSRPETLPKRNITSVYLNDPDGELERIQFEQNDRVVVSNITFPALRAQTVYDNRIEDGTFELAQIMAHTPGVPGSTVNRDSVLNLTTGGAANIDVTVCSVKWGNGAGNAEG